MTSALVLKVYDPELPVQVKLAASGTAVRAVLEQQHGDVWHPVEYISKRLNDTESRYSATECEMLGLLKGTMAGLFRTKPFSTCWGMLF